MKMTTLIAAALAAMTAPACAQQWPHGYGSTTQRDQPTTQYYDPRGNHVGTAQTDSQGTTTFRDDRGTVTGRAYSNGHRR